MRSVTYSMGVSPDGYIATLPAVQGNARLASGGLAEEIERLRAEPAGATSRSAARLSPPRRPRWA